MNIQLEILEEAISDVGYWSWWAEKLPEAFQIEFGGTHVWSPPSSSDSPPSGQIALRFGNPISVCFLKSVNSKLPDNWAELFRDDQLESFSINYGEFKFNDLNFIKELQNSNFILEKKYGQQPYQLFDGGVPNYSLAFIAGEVGFIILAEELRIINRTGDINVDDIEELVSNWWAYWKEYWRLKGTDNELPKDYACEVTIPLKADH
ncbi:hypothetical protein [Bacillus sp. FSL K6-6540]|uniref:hypothetical protein n=1 Tax=Bacillus sp. FSL K6-6540 TaxID=2921512 RepID=UPI0030F81287